MKIKLLIGPLLLAGFAACGAQRAPSTSAGVSSQPTPFNGDRAFEDLKAMVGFGPRPSGSEAIAKTQEYIIAELEKAGLTPQKDEFEASTPRGRIKMINIRAVRPGSKPTIIAL